MKEAHSLHKKHPRHSIFDYYSYIAARDNNYSLLTGDWKLKRYINNKVKVHGAIWYIQRLKEKKIINKEKEKEIYKIWLDDDTVYIEDNILKEEIKKIEHQEKIKK